MTSIATKRHVARAELLEFVRRRHRDVLAFRRDPGRPVDDDG